MFNKKNEVNDKKIKTTYIFGDPEANLTEYIFSKFSEDDVFFVASGEKKWRFDNYRDQPAVVFFLRSDDYKARDIFPYMLGLKNIELPARYKNVTPNFKEIFICSFSSPEELTFENHFANYKEFKSFYNKLDSIVYFYKNGSFDLIRKNKEG